MSYEDDDEVESIVLGAAYAGPLPDRTPGEVERQVCAISGRSPLDELCAMLDSADWLYARAKGIRQLAKLKAIDWIEKNGEFDIGPQHYSVSYACTVKCIAPMPVATNYSTALVETLTAFSTPWSRNPLSPARLEGFLMSQLMAGFSKFSERPD